MVQTCYICKWRADKLPRRSFHKFPYDEVEKQKWLAMIGKSNVSVGKRTSVCSIHFDVSCFRYGLVNGRELLRQGSLPTIHLTRPPEADPCEGLYSMHQVEVDIKVEPHSHSPDDWTSGIGECIEGDADTDPAAPDSMNQIIKTEMDATLQNSSYKPITIEVAQASSVPNKSYPKNKPNTSKILKMDVSKRKEILKKQSLIRMLVEKLRRDHIKLKNYIQSLEERKTTRRKRKNVEVSVENCNEVLFE